MEGIFLNFLNRSIIAGYLVLGILALRWIFRKAPRSFWLLAWAMVGLRLLCPIQIESVLSLVPNPAPISHTAVIQVQEQPSYSAPILEPVEAPLANEAHKAPGSAVPTAAPAPEKKVDSHQMILKIGGVVWLLGIGVMLIYAVISWLRIRLRVREAVEQDGLYFCDHIETPFLLGLVHPKIYLPSDIDKEDVPYVAAHERSHMRHGDQWWKPLGFILLAVYWFHPLIWVAYLLFSRDLEYACDERAVRGMNTGYRKEYMQALIDCSASRRTLGLVAFGEVGVKERVKNIMGYQKPGFWITVIALVTATALGVFFLTNRPQEEPPEITVVQSVDEFLAALGSNREVVLGPGNFDLSEASDYGKPSKNPAYSWKQCRDGYELRLENIHGLTVRGDGKENTSLVTTPRSAHVMAFWQCEDIYIENLTAGHTIMAEPCIGGVLGFENCARINVTGTGLYGCGVDGIDGSMTRELTVKDTDIYDCSLWGLSLYHCSNVLVDHCRFYDLGTEIAGASSVFNLEDCIDITIENSEIRDNQVSHLMEVQGGSDLTLKDNLWKANRSKVAAFAFVNHSPLMEGNQFEENAVRQWLGDSSEPAIDGEGNVLDETFFAPNTPAPRPNPGQKQVYASTVDELIAAIAPDTQIILDAELYDLSTATGYGTENGEFYYWYDNFDGPQLVIHDVKNFSITTGDGDRKAHTISAVPRYANVLAFKQCRDVTISGFTAGHTKELGSCMGGVIYIEDCDNMTVANCGLFGCGILGVQASLSEGVTVENCEIYECSNGGIELRNVKNAAINRCTFRDLGGQELFLDGCDDVTVDGYTYNSDMNYDFSTGTFQKKTGYTAATSLPSDTVEQFAQEIKADILKHQWEALSEKIYYPITIGDTIIDSSQAFLALEPGEHLRPEFVSAIEAESCKEMFCNYQGIMMGAEGEIWISAIYEDGEHEVLEIVALNGMLR